MRKLLRVFGLAMLLFAVDSVSAEEILIEPIMPRRDARRYATPSDGRLRVVNEVTRECAAGEFLQVNLAGVAQQTDRPQRLYSKPLVLIYDANNKLVGRDPLELGDDWRFMSSYLPFLVPEDGEYTIRCFDRRGNAEWPMVLTVDSSVFMPLMANNRNVDTENMKRTPRNGFWYTSFDFTAAGEQEYMANVKVDFTLTRQQQRQHRRRGFTEVVVSVLGPEGIVQSVECPGDSASVECVIPFSTSGDIADYEVCVIFVDEHDEIAAEVSVEIMAELLPAGEG